MKKIIIFISIILSSTIILGQNTPSVGSIAGEFNVSATGAATYDIPIEIPAGVNGLQPQIALTYNSQSGNGVAGYGLNISGISLITKVPKDIYHDGTAAGVEYGNSAALSIDGQRLILTSGQALSDGAVYCPENDPFTKVVCKVVLHHYAAGRPIYSECLELRDKKGNFYKYGSSTGLNYTGLWYLDSIEDVFGNTVIYNYHRYVNNGGHVYLKNIRYGGNVKTNDADKFEIDFEYVERSDKSIYTLGGSRLTISHRLSSIKVKKLLNNSILREYFLDYAEEYHAHPNSVGSNYHNIDHFSRVKQIRLKNGAGEELPPITFDWNFLPSLAQEDVLETQTLETSYNNPAYYAADLTGDGLPEIIVVDGVSKGATTVATSGQMTVFRASKTGNDPVSYSLDSVYTLTNGFSINYAGQILSGNLNVVIRPALYLDYNGDGEMDFVVPIVVIDGNDRQILFKFIGGKLAGTNVIVDTDGYDRNPLFTAMDINNDGKWEIVGVERNKTDGKHEVFSISTQNNHQRTVLTSVSLGDRPTKILAADYNNDGMTDIIVFYDDGCKRLNNVSGTLVVNTSDIFFPLSGKMMVKAGDFNGDGAVDFLYNRGSGENWYFLLNDGSGAFPQSLASDISLGDQSWTQRDDDLFDCHILDFDFDGKSDVVISKTTFRGSGWTEAWGSTEFGSVKTYWLRSTGNSLVEVANVVSINEYDKYFPSRYFTGDFDGDGYVELMNYGYNCFDNNSHNNRWRMYKNPNLNLQSSKIQKITDSYGNTTRIFYGIVEDNTDNSYSETTSSTYPLASIKPRLHTAWYVTYGSGNSNYNITEKYFYSDAKVHLQGKGFLGFMQTVRKNLSLNTTTISTQTLDNNFFIPIETKEKTVIDGLTSSLTTTYNIVDKGNRKFFHHPVKKVSVDFDNNTIFAYLNYDAGYGNLLKDSTVYGNNMYVVNKYENFVPSGGMTLPYLPRLITTIKRQPDHNSVFTNKSALEYYSNGLLKKKTENLGTNLSFSSNYTNYDAYGNLLEYNITAADIETLTHKTEYDATHRFPSRKYTIPASNVVSFVYDVFGNKVSETDETEHNNPLTTNYTYNNWGQLIQMRTPEGVESYFSYAWGNSPEKRYYKMLQGVAQPWVKTWYDSRGRETETESIGVKNIVLKTTTHYNIRGLIDTIRTQTGSLNKYTHYNYDNRSRRIKEKYSTGKIVDYVYNNFTTTIVSNGRTYSKTIDAQGNIKTSTEPEGGIINYLYHSNGKPKKITANALVTELQYDEVGNQISLSDPDAGTTLYEYDALGRLTKQTDARDSVSINSYDVFGRLTSNQVGNKIINYVYGTTGNAKNRLIGKQSGNYSIKYVYDNFGRLISEVYCIGRDLYPYNYTYNQQGQLASKTMPNNVTLSYHYDNHGNNIAIDLNNSRVWELISETGMQTLSSLGTSGMTSKTDRDSYGMLKIQSFSVNYAILISFLQYNFDPITGNLLSRINIPDAEYFTYDNQDRLKSVRKNGITGNIQYTPSGNIDVKWDVGRYDYYPWWSSAVKNTYNDKGLISEEEQNIVYDALGNATNISEIKDNDFYELRLYYGPDNCRWQTELCKNSSRPEQSTIFLPDLDIVNKRVANSKTTSELYYYISGPEGLIGVYYICDNARGQMFYAQCDHLGSVLRLTDAMGYPVFTATYDAWGSQKVIQNEINFHRGYTLHEHLPEFRLINMNGRLYDPVLGRMLSPDNFVQMPNNSQNYNRYSYCLNNPLKYTDPSGEVWFVPLVAGAIIGAIQGHMMATANDATGWAMAGYILGGATIGAAASMASAGVGTAVGSAISFGGFAGGFVTGASAGLVGGIIGGSGNAWLGGESFGQGILSGLKAGGIGALTGGIMGGLTGLYQQRIEQAIFRKGNEILGITAEDAVPATDVFLKQAQETWFPGAPMEHINNFSVEHPSALAIENFNNNPGSLAQTIAGQNNGFFSGRSDVFFVKNAFSSARQLFLSMGHEFVHVSQYAYLGSINAKYSLLFSNKFKDLLDFYAYSYESTLKSAYFPKEQQLNSFSVSELKQMMAQYRQYTGSLNYIQFAWTNTHNFIYPF